MDQELIQGLDWDYCGRCGEIATSPHWIKDKQGTFTGHTGCAVGQYYAHASND